MNEICAFCGKQFGMSMPIRVSPLGESVMCRKCQINYKNPLVAKIKLGDQDVIRQEIERIKSETKNQSAMLDRAIEDIIKEETMRLANDNVAQEAERLRQQRLEEEHARIQEAFEKIRDIPVTTEDIDRKYKIIGPLIFNTTNRGVFTSVYNVLSAKYSKFPHDILLVKPTSESLAGSNWGVFLLSLMDVSPQFEGNVGQQHFDRAFYIGLAEMKLRAAEMGANAIIGMKMDFDLDTTNFGAFYLQMYGTAVLVEED